MSSDAPSPARLATVAEYVAGAPRSSADLIALCELAALLCGVPNAAVNLLGDTSQHQIAVVGGVPRTSTDDDSMYVVAIAGDQDFVVEDASRDERFATNPGVDGPVTAIRFYAASVLRSPAGHVVGTLCVFDDAPGTLGERQRSALAKLAHQVVDVLELQRQIRRLEATAAELTRSQEQFTAFAGQISHDLKTPLAATIGFSELLGEMPGIAADPIALSYVGRCMSSGRRMLKMIDDLVAYARVVAVPRKQPVTLDEVMPDVLRDLGDLSAGATVGWAGPHVNADPDQVRTLLENLIRNALTYRRNGVPCRVSVTSIDIAGAVELRVTDNGSGIPADRRSAVLTPMTRLRRDVAGTGVGLALCSRIVAAHGGTLRLGDTPGGGTAVTVVLPA